MNKVYCIKEHPYLTIGKCYDVTEPDNTPNYWLIDDRGFDVYKPNHIFKSPEDYIDYQISKIL